MLAVFSLKVQMRCWTPTLMPGMMSRRYKLWKGRLIVGSSEEAPVLARLDGFRLSLLMLLEFGVGGSLMVHIESLADEWETDGSSPIYSFTTDSQTGITRG